MSGYAALLSQPGKWAVDAVCAQVDPELFFPPQGGSAKPAKQICASCPVLDDCRAWTFAFEAKYGVQPGIFAAMSERERAKMPRLRICRTADCTEVLQSRYVVHCETHRREARAESLARYERSAS